MNIKIIKNDKEHEEMMGEFDKLLEIVMKKGEENTDREILDQMELLAIVIEKYEEKRWPIGSEPDPISMIKFIMKQKELRATDMKEYFDGKLHDFMKL